MSDETFRCTIEARYELGGARSVMDESEGMEDAIGAALFAFFCGDLDAFSSKVWRVLGYPEQFDDCETLPKIFPYLRRDLRELRKDESERNAAVIEAMRCIVADWDSGKLWDDAADSSG